MPRQKDLTGNTYGHLTVLEYAGRYKHGGSQWLCRCALCGSTKVLPVRALTIQKSCSASCGVTKSNKERARHGMWRSQEYKVWAAIKRRSFNPNSGHYHRYGGRGIVMCEEWCNSFEAFYAHVGPSPSPKHSLDRVDNNKGYEPGNVRWATQKEQCRNTCRNNRVLYKGEEKCLAEWAEVLGMRPSLLYGRWSKGVRGDDLFSTTRLKYGSIPKKS